MELSPQICTCCRNFVNGGLHVVALLCLGEFIQGRQVACVMMSVM